MHQIEEVKVEKQTSEENGKNMADMEEVAKAPSEHASLMGLNDASDEFFDVSEPLDYDQSENGWPSDFGPEMYSQVLPDLWELFYEQVAFQKCRRLHEA